ncbi:site-specific integrase [Halomonas sp. TBZ9]|uniref:Site-specific integrase n=1 Tax=Vreelandella azerica TaxID=2732867 RepID=A0A7Y3X9G6_9GAMM|nr:site-specific integrase [Halomonas azerica]NOG31692.1 site-specific integrase [Halomonas azerica]
MRKRSTPPSTPVSQSHGQNTQGEFAVDTVGLSRDARRLLSESVSPNTVRAMRADLKVYQQAGGCLPATETEIVNYLSAQNALGKAPATLVRYANSLHMWHRYHDLPSPVKTIAVRSVIRGIKRSRDMRQASAPALRLKELHALLDSLDRETLYGLRDAAMFALAFYGACRRSEVVAITVDDIEWRPEGIIVTVHHSKTNKSGRVETKSIVRASEKARYCPVRLLEAWLQASDIRRGAIFRAVSLAGRIGAGRLSAQNIHVRMQKALETAGLAAKGYSPHSFRAGFITEAHLRGRSNVQIKRVSGHRDQRTFEQYIRIADAFEDNANDFFSLDE